MTDEMLMHFTSEQHLSVQAVEAGVLLWFREASAASAYITIASMWCRMHHNPTNIHTLEHWTHGAALSAI
jgi:hypothetical protein